MMTDTKASQIDIEAILYCNFRPPCDEPYEGVNKNSDATRYDWDWEDFSEITETLVHMIVNHIAAIEDRGTLNMNSPFPVICAYMEYEINDCILGMWGHPSSQEMMFERVKAYKRPIMIIARDIIPLARRCAESGEQPDLKSLFGFAEFLYPKVLTAIQNRLRQESV